MGTVVERFVKFPLAGCAHDGGRIVRRHAGLGWVFIHRSFAVVAKQKGFTFFYLEQWNEKKAYIVIHPSGIRLIQPAVRASSGNVLQLSGFGLYTGDYKHGTFDCSFPIVLFVFV